MTPVQSAKALKISLRKRFPATCFSVVIQNYDTCTVSWTDGPTVHVVHEYTGEAEGKGFDGMTDSTTYRKATLPDGRPSSIGFLFTNRTISPALARRCAEQAAAYWGDCDPIPDITATGGGGFDMVDGNHRIRPDLTLDWYQAIYQAAGDASRFQRPDSFRGGLAICV
jgi:hypothetical protein